MGSVSRDNKSKNQKGMLKIKNTDRNEECFQWTLQFTGCC